MQKLKKRRKIKGTNYLNEIYIHNNSITSTNTRTSISIATQIK